MTIRAPHNELDRLRRLGVHILIPSTDEGLSYKHEASARGKERNPTGSAEEKSAEAVRLTEKPLALYQGPFLEAG